MSFYGVVVAAGRGERFGAPKASVALAGIPLFRRASEALLAGGADGVVVVGEVPGGVPGGPRRRDSVAAGLAALPAGVRLVLVHDAARPLASARLVQAVAARLDAGDVDGVVPALTIGDTVKRVSGERVLGTVPRADLVTVQTPQGFRLDALLAAHAVDDAEATDDAQLVERHGGKVVFVPGESTNFKITVPSDLLLAEALLR